MTQSPSRWHVADQETSYQTTLTKKFLNRKSWVPRDPRKIICVIPGVIHKIHVKTGRHVLRGDPLLVLEAMKMQNDIVAERMER